MDNLTHSLFALTLARTRLGRVGRGATLALVVASNAPDVDAVSALAGGMGSYLRWHRGPTHGLLGIVALGCASGALAWGACRWRKPAGASGAADARLGPLVGISMLAVLFHILMDLPTSYGTRLLSPFDWHWFALDWLPIVDIYLLAALAGGLFFGRGSSEARKRNAAIALVLMAVNYGVRGAAHHRALDLGPRLFGPTLPAACGPARPGPGEDIAWLPVDYWPRRPVAEPAPAGRRCLVEMAAMPTFTSPFAWRIVAEISSAYEIHDLDVLDPRLLSPATAAEVLWRVTVRYPNVWTPPVFRAAGSPSALAFLGFARFPAARTVVDGTGAAVVRLTDIRFTAPVTLGPRAGPQGGTVGPFAVDVHVAPDGRVVSDAFTR